MKNAGIKITVDTTEVKEATQMIGDMAECMKSLRKAFSAMLRTMFVGRLFGLITKEQRNDIVASLTELIKSAVELEASVETEEKSKQDEEFARFVEKVRNTPVEPVRNDDEAPKA